MREPAVVHPTKPSRYLHKNDVSSHNSAYGSPSQYYDQKFETMRHIECEPSRQIKLLRMTAIA